MSGVQDGGGGVLALIPARGGSKGLPGKNVRPLAGHPLLWHSVACARSLPDVTRTVLSTDDPEIAAVGRACGVEVPFLRPAELARDDTPMSEVVRHAVTRASAEGHRPWAVLLLDPTSPLRDPELVTAAIEQLRRDESIDGVVSVSEPTFRPTWVGVREGPRGLERFFPGATGVTRRQDAERFLRINGNFYVWRADFAAGLSGDWFAAGRHAGAVIPERYAFSIDDRFEFDLVAAVLAAGLVEPPWLR